ncbi:DUF3540 domain-containing protein [Bermanella marisrubri]|uniref:DUF3540 domain-containing protein n=1 Tax=Bermanella marisrubri TaxID=207949 RepID=Q1N521_9GAMM|nr:DUF3540 domain-containing protein [Bermanella marisrubri]EAT13257.1 hypothetical protein RED65_00815 [Oceanobacter sp. RED65] [Bermanella marisrubri]QIZ84024.1 DUF3540 domain-containing protein [Bermanella marisrubri]
MTTQQIAHQFLNDQFKGNTPQATRDVATVLEQDNTSFALQLDSGQIVSAKAATSCLYQPEERDLVELFFHPAHGYFIVSILSREAHVTGKIQHAHGIEIESPTLALKNNHTRLQSQTVDLQTQDYHQQSKEMRVETDTAHYVGETTHVSTGTLMQKIKDSFKFIERLEQVKAQDVIHTIKNAFIQRSKQVDITAKSDVKINGDRIHMG